MDFKHEAHARAYCTHDEEKYFQTVTLLECMAHANNEDYKKSVDRNVCHPDYPWFTLSRTQRHIYSELTSPENFRREGTNIVTTYIEEHFMNRKDQPKQDNKIAVKENGQAILIPANAFKNDRKTNRYYGRIRLVGVDSFAEYVMPKSLSEGKFRLEIELVNVHLDQKPLFLVVGEGNDQTKHKIDIPYTKGKWAVVEVEIVIGPGKKIRLTREGDHAFGLTISKLQLYKC